MNHFESATDGASSMDDFEELIRRVRTGDASAATTLFHRYEPEIRRVIRVRLSDPRLRRVLDSSDICQSVLANFFLRVGLGEFDLQSPEELLHLLLKMARNKLYDKARYHQADRRGSGKIESLNSETAPDPTAKAPGPMQIVIHRDLLEAVRSRLTAEERYLADQRANGREWADLARELHSQPDALRKQLKRALDRIGNELGLEMLDHDDH